MKVQHDSLDERSDSPDLPEPLYEEVGDFGLQVLKSLETSFLSSSNAETHEVPDDPPLRLIPVDSRQMDQINTLDPELSIGEREADCSPSTNKRRTQQLGCTQSQELLLQELSSAFTRKTQEEEEEERPYDVWQANLKKEGTESQKDLIITTWHIIERETFFF